MAYSFNTTTISIAGSDQAPLLDISVSGTAAELDITGAADNAHTYEAGIPDYSVTFTILGFTAKAVGDEGTIAIAGDTWTGTSGEFTTGVITSVESSGSLDDVITTAVTVKQHTVEV